MSTPNKLLFSQFDPVIKQDWIEKVNSDLKGADFNKKLVWKNLNNIPFQPCYFKEDTNLPLPNTGVNSENFTNFRELKVSSANAANTEALKALKEGITGLLFHLKESVPVAELLKDIDLNNIAVSFYLENSSVEFLSDFFDYAEKSGINPENLKGYADTGIIYNYLTSGLLFESNLQALTRLTALGKSFPNFKTITVSGTVFMDSGGNQVQETAFSLNALVYLVNKCLENNIPAETVFQNLHIQFAVGSEYFIEIGKFRAFNSLLFEIAGSYGVSQFNHMLTAKTAVWSKSVTDPHTNLLRCTTEAMSAILGNANGVIIDPFDKEYKEPSDFSKRIAGNIATILKEESYFGKVSNPVDGSYYIEEVTSKIAEKALELFKEVEACGGFLVAVEREFIQQQIAEIRQRKITLLNRRSLAMVGVNKYPNLMENVPSEILSGIFKSNGKYLTPRRASIEIEALRKLSEEIVEEIHRRPVVELCSFGNLTMRKARAAFSYDFLGVSGFEILEEKSYDTAEEAAIVSAASPSDVVVICSSDPDYETHAISFVKSFRTINKDKVLLLAGNPTELMEDLLKAGLDNCIHLRSDVINTISGIQHKIRDLVPQ